MANFTAGTSFSDGVTNDVTAAKLNALIADAVPTSNLSLNSTTGTIANFTASTANVTLGTIPTLTAGTTTSTAATITTVTIPTLTAGTTTSTAASITSGTIQTLTSSTATITGGTFSGSVNSTAGTIGTLNSTTGTIGNLSTTLAGDFTISQGTGTIGTGVITAAKMANPQYTGFRNRIINGNMRIDQRNNGASITPADGQFSVDRFRFTLSQPSKITCQQNAASVTPPTGFTNYLGITSTSSYSLGSTDNFQLQHPIEGYNISDLNWGSANAQKITISFWVYSSLTGTFGGALYNGASNYFYPFSYSISSSNTWEKKTITINGASSGTWATDNSAGIYIQFSIGAGSSYLGTAGTWGSSVYLGVTGQQQIVSNSGATWYITGIQLEAGSTATDFERRPYGTELALCQRYCLKYCGNASFEDVNCNLIGFNGTTAYGPVYTVVPMRTTPSISSSGLRLVDQTNVISINSIASTGANYSGPYNLNIAVSVASGVTQYRSYQIQANNSTSAYLILSSEL